MSKSGKRRLRKAHEAFKRMYPSSFCYKRETLAGTFHYLHLGPRAV